MKRVPLTLILFSLTTVSLFAQGLVIGGQTVGIGTVGVNSMSPAILTPTVTGGSGSYSWTVVGTPLPSGLSILNQDGRIFGTPAAATTSGGIPITLKVTDRNSSTLTATAVVTIIIRDALNFGPLNALPAAALNVPYSQCLNAAGGAVGTGTPVMYTLASGSLPPGVFLTNNSCGTGTTSAILQGTPTQAGSFAFSIKAVDSEMREVTRTLLLTVGATPTLSLSNNSLQFFCTINSNCSTPQTAVIDVKSSPTDGYTVAAAALPPPPQWLTSFILDKTTTPARLTLTVTPGSATGVTTATIQISSSVGVTPILLTIVLNTTSDRGIFSTDPNPAVINTNPGIAPPPLTIKLRSTGVDASYNLTSLTSTGGNWLVLNQNLVSLISGTADISVQGNPTGLGTGSYAGQINVLSGGVQLFTIPVTFNVGTTQLLLGTTALNFKYDNGTGSANQQQAVTVTSSSGAGVSFSASASTTNGINWLTVSPLLATTPTSIAVGLTNTLPGPGTHTGIITLNSGNAASQYIQVTLVVSGSPAIILSPASMSFTQQVGTGQSAAQTLSLTSSGASNFNFSAGTITSDNGNWLLLSKTADTTPSNIQVSVNATGLAVGVYSGRVVISSNETANSPFVVPITLTVTQVGSLGATPTSLSFTYQVGGELPGGQQLLIASSNTAQFTINSTSSGWLRVPQSAGTTPASITVSVNPTDLAPGSYTGSLAIQSATAGQITVPVTLAVSSANTLKVTPTSLGFSHRLGSTPPPAQIIRVTSNIAAAQFTTSARLSSGSWLSVTPSNGSTPTDVAVSVDPSLLSIGDYTGTILLTPADGSPTINVPVSLSVLTQAKPSIRSVTNAASFFITDATPGLIFTLFGTGVGADPLTGVTLNNGVFSTTSGGTRVLFDEFPAPMIYAGRDQVAGVIPYGIASRTNVQVVVENRGVRSDPFQMRVAATSPGIFTLNASGRGNAAALNQNGSVNSASNPAAAGSVIVLYVTGEGNYQPTPTDGSLTQAPLPVLRAAVNVRFGTTQATVDYAGAAPGLVAGVMQINARVPSGISGDVPVSVNIGGNPAQTGVTIAVR